MSQDKAALLAAINSSVQAPKSQTKGEVARSVKGLNESNGVSNRVAHDLISNASRANHPSDVA